MQKMDESLLSSQQSSTSGSISTPKSIRQGTNFSISWDTCSVYLLNKDGSLSDSKGDFAIRLTSLVEAGGNTGYMASVKRKIDQDERNCFFSMESAMCRNKFMSQLNSSFGSGGMSLALNEHLFGNFLQFLKNESGILSIRKAARVIGLQSCGKVWVMNGNVQIQSDGRCITPDESNYIWLNHNVLGDIGNVPCHSLLPKIVTPLSVSPISRLLSAMKVVLKHNYLAGLLTVSGGIMALHYSKIIEVLSGCPIVVAVGPSETGKSTSIKAALAFSGSTQSSMYVKGSNAFFLERSSVSSLPYAIDDPPKATSKGGSVDINSLIVDLYNGCKTANLRSGPLKPISLPLIASNYNLDKEERVSTRATIINFSLPSIGPVDEEEEEVFSELEDLINGGDVSACIGWAIALGEKPKLLREEVLVVKDRLRGQFKGRNCKNWATLLFFLKKLLEHSRECLPFEEVVQFAADAHAASTRFGTVVTAPQTFLLDPQELLITTLKEIISFCEHKSLSEIKVFMVSNCFVGSTKEPVIAVCLKDIESMLSYSHSEIKTTLEKKRYAQISSHSFLRADSPTCTIIKGKTDRKRRCLAFFQQMMCQNLAKHLIKLTTIEGYSSTNEDPAVINEDPAVINEDPAAINEDPAAINEDPTAIKENPAAINEDPAAIKEDLSIDVKDSLHIWQDDSVLQVGKEVEVKETLPTKRRNKNADACLYDGLYMSPSSKKRHKRTNN